MAFHRGLVQDSAIIDPLAESKHREGDHRGLNDKLESYQVRQDMISSSSGECGLTVKCIECGDKLVAERAELGYNYCTKKQCQAKHHEGLTITAIGVNKSADTFIVGDQEELRKRAEAGEFAKKDSGLGISYRSPRTGRELPSRQRASGGSPTRRAPARRPWTREQEKIVRLYHGMGLAPRQIVERARQNTPQLGITESLVIKIMCSPPAK